MSAELGVAVEIDDKGNTIIGCYPNLYRSAIVWTGCNNVLYCEKGVNLHNTKLTFNGNNSLIYIHANTPRYYELDLSLFSDSVIHIGKRCRAKQTVKAVIGEKKHLFIGDDCLFSYGITLRNADGHLVFDASDYGRTNRAESILIGDHVWVGQDSLILKGTQIDSGAVIGGRSVVPGKKITHNSSWAGNPAKQIKENVFWEWSFPDDFDDKALNDADNYVSFLEAARGNDADKDEWIFKYNADETLGWDELDENLSKGSAIEKCEYLHSLNSQNMKNRFVH